MGWKKLVGALVLLPLLFFALIVTLHDVFFVEHHTHFCDGTNIYQLPREVSIPGYIKGPSSKQVVVFVHGIRDDGISAWKSDIGQYWPAMAANQQKDWDFYVDQYQDDIPITKIATHMGIDLAEVFESHENVVVVAHSMGGLAVREFLFKNPQYAKKISTIYLLATPSLGSKLANLVSRLGFGNKQSTDLRTVDVNPFLQQQVTKWKSLQQKPYTYCAYETRKTWFFEVVDESSSAALCDNDAEPIDASHTTIVKPECPTSDVNKILVAILREHSLATKPANSLSQGRESKNPPDQSTEQPANSRPSASGRDAARLPSTVQSTYRFIGPFRIARNGNAVVFDLTDILRDKGLENRKVLIKSVTVIAQVSAESDQAFSFDQELLVPSDGGLQHPPIFSGTDYGKYLSLNEDYVPRQRILRVTIATDSGRAVHSVSPISWTANLETSSLSSGEIRAMRSVPIEVGPKGLPLQLFLWTLWGGDNYIELSSVDVKLTVEATPD
jgi:predicted alpha/beta hydrolase family esterase